MKRDEVISAHIKANRAASLLTVIYWLPRVLYIMNHAVFVIGKLLKGSSAKLCLRPRIAFILLLVFFFCFFPGGPAKARAKESKTSLRLLLSAICLFLLISIISCCLVCESRDCS